MTKRTVQKGRCHLLREKCDFWLNICHLQFSYPRSSRKSDALVKLQIVTCILGSCLLPFCQLSWSQLFQTLDLTIKYFPLKYSFTMEIKIYLDKRATLKKIKGLLSLLSKSYCTVHGLANQHLSSPFPCKSLWQSSIYFLKSKLLTGWESQSRLSKQAPVPDVFLQLWF